MKISLVNPLEKKSLFFRIYPALFAILVEMMGVGLLFPMFIQLFSPSSSFSSIEAPFPKSEALLSIAYLLYPLGLFIGASFLGDLSDRFGRKKVLLLSMLGMFISYFVMWISFLFSSLFFFLLARGFSGLMGGAQPIAQAAVADLTPQNNRLLNMRYISFTTSIGLVLGPVLGGLFVPEDVWSYSIPFLLACVISLAAFFSIQLSFKETFFPKKRKKTLFRRVFFVYVDAFKHRRIRVLSIVFLFSQIAFGIYYQIIVILLQYKFSYSPFMQSLFYGFLGLFFVLSLIFFMPILVKRIQPSIHAFVATLFMGVFEIATSFSDAIYLLWIWGAFFAVANVISFTSLMGLFSKEVDISSQGWAMGLFVSLIAFAFIVASLLMQSVSYFSLPTLLFIGGVTGVLASLLLFSVSSSKEKTL